MRNSNQEKDWNDLTASATEKLAAVSYKWTLLSESVREVAALRKLELDMYNGGFLQFFCNWGYDSFEAALSGLKKVGAPEMHSFLSKTYLIIEKYQEDPRVNELWDLPKVISDSDCAQIDSYTKKILSMVHQLYKQGEQG